MKNILKTIDISHDRYAFQCYDASTSINLTLFVYKIRAIDNHS